jgi:hypothetical protein
MERVRLLALLVLPAAFAAGCGKESGTTTADATPAADAATKASNAVDPGNVSPQNLPKEPKVADAVGARADVTLKDCGATKRQALATGTVKNSTKRATDYAITISWVNKRSDVRTRGVAVLRDLAPGEQRPWKIAAAPHSGIATCTVFVQRGNVR